MKFHHSVAPFVTLPCTGAVVFLYGVLVLLGTRCMSDRKPYDMSSAKRWYNVIQIIVCTATFAQLLPFFVSSEHRYGIGLANNETIEFWVFVYYCCKVLDLFDTVIIVFEKRTRQLTLLHVWHHASIVPLFAFYLHTGLGAGSVSTLPLLNSLIHVLMYSHYLVMTLAPKINAWWKPLLTGSQICQHVVLMAYMVTNWLYGGRPDDFTPAVFISGMLWGLSILVLFGNFYVQQYLNGKNKKGQ